MSNERNWVSQKSSGVNWEPTKNEKHRKPLIGFLKNVQENQGKDKNSTVYTVAPEKGGEDVMFWGSKVLDDQMQACNIGDLVKIEYLGKKTGEKGGREYHDWELFVAPGEGTAPQTSPEPQPAEATAEGEEDDDLPF